jgi:excisionase family DNA binding protein
MSNRSRSPETSTPREMMNTREVADYLRIKERKVYEMVRGKEIPCSRVTGKWLFPKHLIDLWVAQKTDYAQTGGETRLPAAVAAGSHDPLLDWALRESRCGLALLPGGSLDGVRRLAAGEATIAGLHVLDPDTGTYNVPVVRDILRGDQVVMLNWAYREQGLVLAPGNPLGIATLKDLVSTKARVIQRQAEAGSQILLAHLLGAAGIKSADLARRSRLQPALNESDLGLAIAEGKADAGLAVRAVANQFRLEFVPLHRERFDVVMRRRDYFERPAHTLLAFARTPEFAARAAEFGGYDITELGRVVYNGE